MVGFTELFRQPGICWRRSRKRVRGGGGGGGQLGERRGRRRICLVYTRNRVGEEGNMPGVYQIKGGGERCNEEEEMKEN